jgi:hypothetical protein
MTVMVSVTLAVAVPAGFAESVTAKVNGVALLLAVGVPLITPLALFSCRPGGRVPLVSFQVYGAVPPAALRLVL